MLVSLAAVVIGPIVTFKVARRQILSPIRQKWMDELRELMSEFLSECQRAIVIEEGFGLINTEMTDEALFKKLLYLEQKLALMLNPREEDHVALVKLVRAITEEVQHGVADFLQFGQKVGDASSLCQKILKSEWTRVKNGGI
jgi:hypothetical protein